MKYLALLIFTLSALAAEPGVVPAARLAEKWKRTKSIAAPVEKVRKGLGLETGAPAAPVEVKVDADTAESFQNIQFRKDSDELVGSTTFAQLAEIAKAMQAAGTEKFLVEGHTCDLGGDTHNLSLSQRRALAVRAELVKAGVPSERLQVIGFGKSDPLVQNTDEAAREKNRRVQIFRKL
jgi:outer membrane protein OmpA-like peptidoglycan-associated protein